MSRILLIVVLLTGSICACENTKASISNSHLQEAVIEFDRALNQRNLKSVMAFLHPDLHIETKIPNGLLVLTYQEYEKAIQFAFENPSQDFRFERKIVAIKDLGNNQFEIESILFSEDRTRLKGYEKSTWMGVNDKFTVRHVETTLVKQ